MFFKKTMEDGRWKIEKEVRLTNDLDDRLLLKESNPGDGVCFSPGGVCFAGLGVLTLSSFVASMDCLLLAGMNARSLLEVRFCRMGVPWAGILCPSNAIRHSWLLALSFDAY